MTEELKGFQLPQRDTAKPKGPEFYKVALSSFEMMVAPKAGRKPNNGPALPFGALDIGQSFNVPLDRSQTALLDAMRKAGLKGAKFRLVTHATHYEIGRIE